jgi:4-amino-4-deoxy-L-arabinose transferase-like glycosyltransferase
MTLKKEYSFLIPLLPFLFWLIDLGNVEAIRQGTEGFYLQVSKEIFQLKSWLVPMYLKQPHWSKPPLHFWLPQPFFIITGGASIFLSRLSILISTIGLSFLIDRWAVKNLQFQKYLLFFVMLASVGFLKYGRIYMMEMPLCLLTAYGSLLFFDFLNDKKSKTLFLAILVTAAANLIKGPVSFVMNFGGVFIFLAYEYYKEKELPLKHFLFWTMGSVFIGSIWYLSCYLSFGSQFIDYFFLRENLGKFQSKSYPIRSVINGLLIFSLPWTFFIPVAFNKNLLSKLWSEKVNRFLIFHFIFFFILWMIPSQRSHHYAMPAQPFFLMILTLLVFRYKDLASKKWLSLSFKGVIFLFSFFTLLLLLSLLFTEVRTDLISLFRVVIGISLLGFCLYSLFKHRENLLRTATLSFLAMGYIWILFAPVFYLPTIPTNVIDRVNKEQVSVIFNKPYFLSELLGKDVRVLNPSLIQADRQNPKKHYIMSQLMYEQHHLKSFLKIQSTWPIWRRGNKFKDIIHAFSEMSLVSLQQNMVLLRPLRP